jgi:orotidine-5'-phosphate decarboxylase
VERAADKLIVALDGLDFSSALQVVAKTSAFAATYKVGLSLFCAYGPSIVKEITALGVDVFLDLKLHDIPTQVAKAVEYSLSLNPRFLSLHALGGQKMLKEAAKAAQGSSTTLLAVSVLTSFDGASWRDLGFPQPIEQDVVRLGELAWSSGIRGLVSSPHEAGILKKSSRRAWMVVCPGVRPKGALGHDQSRFMTPKEAIKAGADLLVIGRPIIEAADIHEAAREINQEILDALTHMRLGQTQNSKDEPPYELA